MRNLLKKLHIMPNPSEEAEGSSRGSKSSDGSLPDKLLHSRSHHGSEHKPFSALSGWLNSHKHSSSSPPSSSNVGMGERAEPSDSASSGGLNVVLDGARLDSGSTNSRDPDGEEEYQIQLALELSAREDPEAVQIEAVKQISLGSCPPENAPAEVVAFRYWNYNALSYDDKILDGFYDVYGIRSESTSERMPSLVDLQITPLSENVSWEAVLVNRATDANLLKLEQKALAMAGNSRSDLQVSVSGDLVQKLAIFVAEYMGGPVRDPDNMSRAWMSLSYSLKSTLGSMVLPLGSLTIGLARHRALLFKVLTDTLGIPCGLVKGQQHTGFDGVAMNFVKIDDGREYIVDLMADPGTLIPSDVAGLQINYEGSLFSATPSGDVDSTRVALFSRFARSSEEHSKEGCMNLSRPIIPEEESRATSDDSRSHCNVEKAVVCESPIRPMQSHTHARSPSWTEGVSSPAVRKMKVKDVSQYMIDAAKENPQLAQKLHDVLLESGVVAPPNLFTEVYSEQSDVSTVSPSLTADKDGTQRLKGTQRSDLPPLPHGVQPNMSPFGVQPEQLKVVEGLGGNLPLELKGVAAQPERSPAKYAQNVPVAAAAAAAAAVVASSMVVAAAKSSTDSNIKLPVAAAATATAAAVAATTAAVNKKYGRLETDGDTDSTSFEQQGSGDPQPDALGVNPEAERVSDKSSSSGKSDVALDDVAECEILWEDITMGERIGLGSYGEVYRGDLHGTEVAVKKFLDQDISGESLEEFKSEVRIMKKLRHPNVVLFMGAVTRAPNLSIVTEFLPRGSLYRLIHRPNNQLDERRRMRMALDTARGMNYLHNCSPVIVHRDLKSPNLLVDKNWVVKVCDFGLSRMKHSTFLSSRSTAGTAEWMAPEVLRNEPSDEKCDVYSFGVILWELSTLQQPWGGMNPMQVVGAVGFQRRRLDIPDNMDPAIAAIIEKCWHTDPKMRPTFSEILASLRPLQKPLTSSHAPRQSASSSNVQKGRTAQATEDPAS